MSNKPFLVLFVDDEPSILKFLSKVMQMAHFEVETASNGADGINKIKTFDFDIIITDIKMPGISGNHLLAYSKDKEESIPVIGMSATPWLMDEALFDGVLSKPFSNDELFHEINRLPTQ